ncbi:solute carrier family 22 member 21-like isoform X2 [Bombus affinis]|uniref:Solute carrier family 22 member 21 isoform X1 n=1 Tax=Bombus terrestris TaxID=30195 RepID=A0A9B0BZF1_BOMTE|nr:solute carrier family 22 member 21 isoform X1 [Bombus terrestris]XP_050600790.1 solute carrier family 22 member 21-like isoform X2 [Bombus affinis]
MGSRMGSRILRGDEEDSMKLFSSQNGESSTTKDGTEGKRGSDRKQEVDRFGYYQMIMFAIISLPLFLSAGFTLAYVFTAGEVKYRCAVSECENPMNTKFDESWVPDSVPNVSEMSKCIRYVVQNHTGACTNQTFTNATQKCDSWIYDPSENTVLSEWDLTCDTNRWKLTLVGTINNVGQFIGLIFAGYISDKYGRRTILTLTTFLSGISGLIHSFSVNYWMFLAFEFIDATVAAGIYSAGFILGMEMAGVNGRVLASTIICCMFAVGEMLLGLIAMWLRSWRMILRMVYGPALLAILLPVLIPESVRWLLANGKHEKVESIYRRMARINGLQISEEAIGAFKELNMVKTEKTEQLVQAEKKSPAMQVLNSSVMLTRLLACSFCWLTNTFVYYGLSLNSVAFAGDKYVNFILVAVVEIPAYFLTWFLTDYIGRKATLSSSFLLSGVFCLAIQFVPTGSLSFLRLILYMGGKWCITMSFSTIYIYTAELFPTNLRHSLLGICSMTGRMGSILSPQTPLLAQIMPELPLILFGCMALSAGLLSLFFPETLGTKLPDTVWEAENIGKVQQKQELQDSPS